MRYYEFVLKTDTETIRENAKINLKEYDYSDPIAAVNTFMYRTLDNDLTFLMYRVKDGAAYSVFSFNEQSYSFHKAYNDISDRLKENRLIETIMGEPCEISMFRYSDCLKEANRRNVCSHTFRIAENANIELIYHDSEGICTGVQDGCKFEEMMIPVANACPLYSFSNENG